jgi:hypothetical protein
LSQSLVAFGQPVESFINGHVVPGP